MNTSLPVKPSKVETLFTEPLQPFVKWPGGKSSELARIKSCLPVTLPKRFIDPFVGGGSVLFAVNPAVKANVNDVCPELISIYNSGRDRNLEFHQKIQVLADAWTSIEKLNDLIEESSIGLMKGSKTVENTFEEIYMEACNALGERQIQLLPEFKKRLSRDYPKKISRMAKLQKEKNRLLPLVEFKDNLEGSVRAAFYMAIRHRYNLARVRQEFHIQRDADFFFLREYCYASMFRFNSKDEFNIPYGGISYNQKSFQIKIDRLYSPAMEERLCNTDFSNLDFADFVKEISPNKDDFMFIDPPYDSDFTDYDGRSFVEKDQVRLSSYLSQTAANVMIVIGDTPLIRSLYPSNKWNIREDNFNYKWTIKSRNERKKTHLTITNY